MSDLTYNRFLEEHDPDDFQRKNNLLLGTLARIDIPPGLPLRTDHWGIDVNIAGHKFSFNFAYNRVSNRFSMNIMRDGLRLWKHYPVADEPLDIPNFLPDNLFQPHGSVVILTNGEEDLPITPESLSKGDHYILVGIGDYIRLARQGAEA